MHNANHTHIQCFVDCLNIYFLANIHIHMNDFDNMYFQIKMFENPLFKTILNKRRG